MCESTDHLVPVIHSDTVPAWLCVRPVLHFQDTMLLKIECLIMMAAIFLSPYTMPFSWLKRVFALDRHCVEGLR